MDATGKSVRKSQFDRVKELDGAKTGKKADATLAAFGFFLFMAAPLLCPSPTAADWGFWSLWFFMLYMDI